MVGISVALATWGLLMAGILRFFAVATAQGDYDDVRPTIAPERPRPTAGGVVGHVVIR